ncbi:hypothetical protein SmJEL517_g00804 [Synchytrium microbalum]|uniref:Cilia- and flagella-associated protein 45 n=1 Tax=Synchytrium microbalum TaxID=1806994 RepID=A0A507CCW7_9FUNG|nr:uncharacterized protein SmJEL517_g00804 [Synchytrium microbalum]TPX37019.1 hypothetical protein SmJEL517_g00804 [Synchytrium microbalum]
MKAPTSTIRAAVSSAAPASNNKEKTITVITRDNIRTLKPHVKGSKPTSSAGKHIAGFVVKSSELTQVRSDAILRTEAEIRRRNAEESLERDEKAAAAKMRRERMEQHDRERAQNAALSELEQEARERSQHLLAKAQAQIDEQEDDIKRLNELILYAKCVAIRDAQIEEKKMIDAEKKLEQSRLDVMMETDRINELKKLEEREKLRVEEQRKGAAIIRKQIEERQEQLVLEEERKDQETQAMLKALRDRAEAEQREKEAKVKAQRLLMQQVVKANTESLEHKRQQRLAEEDEDRKVMVYLLDKDRRQEEAEKEKQLKKIEREKDVARLRAMQEKFADKQAQQDALRAQRAHEAYEREWRRQKKEAAEKASSQERELREERARQSLARESAIAAEAQAMRQEFYRSLQRQKEEEQRLQAETIIKHEKNRAYSLEVQAQIKQKEILRGKDRQEFFKEGEKLAALREEKKKKVDRVKERKIESLRQIGVPEKYCKEIERQSFR